MNLLIFKENPEGVSIHTMDGLEMHIVDPSLIGTSMVDNLEMAEFVIIDNTMNHTKKLQAITFGHKITGYKNGKFERVALV